MLRSAAPRLQTSSLVDMLRFELPLPPGAPAMGTIMGTLAHMAPEQAVGEDMDARSDILSMGVVLYEMATGRAPFRGKTTAAMLTGVISRQKDAGKSPLTTTAIHRLSSYRYSARPLFTRVQGREGSPINAL